MACGVYGKLPAKRDFIALNVSSPVLTVIERWLQGAVAASRNQLGGSWQDIYLTAPIWRFWLGSDICGTWCTGAVMPSVDGIGRYFPLAVVSHGQEREALPPPLDDPLEGWFEEAESALLSALDTERGLDGYGLLSGMRDASAFVAVRAQDKARAVRRGFIWADLQSADGTSIPTGIRDEDYRIATQARTYWWTKGGQRYGPRFYSHPGMPDPALYANLLTGSM